MRTQLGIPALTLALALFSGAARAEKPLSLLPWKAQAGKPFDLMLAGPYACNLAFSHESTYVQKDRIVLAFLATERENIRCAPLTEPFGPEFRIPSLAAGRYPVHAQRLAPCMVGPIACEMWVEPVLVGTLEVTSGPAYDTGWFLHPERVESGDDVRVSLLNTARGSCENGFSPARDTVRGKAVNLAFLTQYYRHLCGKSVHPFGPEFSLGDLAPGSYRVEAYDLPPCAWQDSPCIPVFHPVLVDTLVVGSASSALPVKKGSGRPASPLRRLPGGMGLILPGTRGTGPGLKVERIVTSDGRRVGR